MNLTCVEVANPDYLEDSVLIPASQILSFVVHLRPDSPQAKLVIECQRIRGERFHDLTPYLKTVAEAESARGALIRLLADARSTQIIRWRGSGFVCEEV